MEGGDIISPRSKTYKVVVSGEEFTLSKAQIEFDSPNHFTAAFLGTFSEASSGMLVLDRNPRLFAIIVDYLRGYDVLPLSERAIPETMTIATATRNLAKDADYLGLSRLHHLLSAPKKSFAAWAGVSNQQATLADVLADRLPRDCLWQPGQGLVDAAKLSVPVYALHVGLRVQYSQWTNLSFKQRSCDVLYDPATNTPSPNLTGEPHDDATIQFEGLSPIFLTDLGTVATKLGPECLKFAHTARSFSPVRENLQGPKMHIDFWADEAVFTIVGRSEDEGTWNIRLLCAKTRLRASAALDFFATI